MEQPDNMLKTALDEIERLLTTKTVVGEPIKIGDNTIVPLVAVGFGFGGGSGAGLRLGRCLAAASLVALGRGTIEPAPLAGFRGRAARRLGGGLHRGHRSRWARTTRAWHRPPAGR